MNALRIALGIFSGKIILNFGVQKRLRAFLNPIFTGRGRDGKRQLPRWFPAETVALRGSTPSVIAYGDATFPKGTAFRIAAKFPSSQKASPWGSWLCAAKTDGVYLFRFYFCFSAQNVLRAGFSS